MKNRYLLWFLFAATTMACNDDRPDEFHSADDTKYIRFGAPTISIGNIETRSTLHNELPDGSQFGVLGYCVPRQAETGGITDKFDFYGGDSDWDTKKDLLCADVFYNQEVSYSNGTCMYKNEQGDLTKWYTSDNVGDDAIDPSRFLYSFFAYYPFTSTKGGFSTTPTSKDEVGTPKLTFTMPFEQGGDVTAPLNHELVFDAMLAAKYNHPQYDGNVKLTFYHLLTALRFRVNNYDEGTEEVTIHSLKLSGKFYRSMTIDFSDATKVTQKVSELNKDAYIGTFTIVDESTPESFRKCAANGSMLLGEGTEGTALLLLPNVNAAAGSSLFLGEDKVLTVEYTFRGETKTRTFPDIHLTYTPVQSRRYTASLNFIGGHLILEFIADNSDHWEWDQENDITIN